MVDLFFFIDFDELSLFFYRHHHMEKMQEKKNFFSLFFFLKIHRANKILPITKLYNNLIKIVAMVVKTK